jgi:hypothetical protein
MDSHAGDSLADESGDSCSMDSRVPSLGNHTPWIPAFSLVSGVMKWFEGRADDPFRDDE